MFAGLTATEVAFFMAALVQGVLGGLWLLGGWLIADNRRAATHWAAFSALSALSFLLLVAAMRSPVEPDSGLLRAAGNIAGVVALVALQRGVWLFVGRALTWAGHGVALAVVLLASWVGLDPAFGSVRVGVNSMVLALLSVGMARDLYRHARGPFQFRWPWLLALPLLLAAAMFAGRGLLALLNPASVAAEMTTHSGLNVGSAFGYVVLTLAFHATLMALVVTRLLVDLRRLSLHDSLTGLLNRRALEEALNAQLRRSRRSAEPFVVMMLDADHFKSINDRFGHAVGDVALKHVSALLSSGMREVDRLGRFGGEEFLVLLPGATLSDAVPVAERLRALVVGTPLVNAGTPITVSVSIGLAEWSGVNEDLSRLLVRTDAALYQAKQHGRDRVALAEAPAPALAA